MKPSVSKTVYVDKRPSFAGNLVTIFAGRAERTAETTAMRQNLPGKSHVGRILLNDNTSQERLLDMRLSDIHNAQKKTATFIAHQKNTFITRMEHRQSTWVREHSRRATTLNSLAGRKRDSVVSRNPGLPDSEEGEDDSPEHVKTVDNKEDKDSNIKPVGTQEKKSQDRTDTLPDISSARYNTRFQRGKESTTDTRKSRSEGQAIDVSLPSINKAGKSTNATTETHVPSVLITAEGDTDPANQEINPSTGSAGNTTKRKSRRGNPTFEQLELGGPSPTFISEVLPRIQIRECVRMPTHLSKKARRRRRRRSSAKDDDGNPLSDDRFLRLQHTLAPHLAWQESRDMASIAAGVVNAKKLVSEKLRKFSHVDEEFEDL